MCLLENRDRVVNRIALTEALEKLMSHVDGYDLCNRLLEAGLPAGPVMDTREVMDNPHTLHRDMRWTKDWYTCTGTPIKFSRTPGGLKRVPPHFAADTDAILAEHGFGDEEVESLFEMGVIPHERHK